MKWNSPRALAWGPGLCLVLLLAGCGKDQFWIPGLTLPRDSVIISQSETTKLESKVTDFPLQSEAEKVLLVNFDNPHGWPTVAAHMDILLNDRHYLDLMADLAAIFGEKVPTHAPDFLGARMYVRQKSPYVIALLDLENLGDPSAAPVKPASEKKAAVMGRYYLAVIKMNTPLHDPPPPEKKPDAPGTPTPAAPAAPGAAATPTPPPPPPG